MARFETRLILLLSTMIVLACLILEFACGTDRYPCDDPFVGTALPPGEERDGYFDPSCVGTSANLTW